MPHQVLTTTRPGNPTVYPVNFLSRPIFVESLDAVRLDQKRRGQVFYLPNGERFVWIAYTGREAEMSGILGFFKKVAGIAAPFANLIPGVGQIASAGLAAVASIPGGNSGVAKGLAGINAYGDSVMSALNQIAGQVAAVQNGQTTAASLITEAERIANSLSDAGKVYQPKKGKDAAALANFKSQAAAKVQEIKSAATAAEQRAAQVQQQQQQAAQQAANSISIDTTTLLIAGGIGLGAILLLRR